MKKLFTLFTALLLLGSMMVVQADTWTVAGSNTTILGASWDPSKTANDMINVSGNDWYLLKANKTLASGTLEYKVCKNHGWGTAYPSSNKQFSLTAGTYDVLFKFVSGSNSVSEEKVTTWTVAGSESLLGSNWNTGDTNNDMVRSGDNWTLTKNHVLLSVGTTYECKVAANHAWTHAFPTNNKTFTITEDGYYNVTFTFNTSTLAVTVNTEFLEPAVPPTPTIKLHGTFTGSWADTEEFAIASGDATASLTLTNLTKGNYELGVKIDGTWTSNGSAFTRDNNSHAVVAGSGNCTFNADRNGDYTFTWTYATSTLEIGYPAIPAQSVTFNSLASEILKGSVINLANCVTSSGIDEPTYRFYIKEKNGEYGDAINANYNFNANGEYVVKVEALEYGEPVAFDESNVVVYQSYTFTNGSTIYVDFTAMTEGEKGVNYPSADAANANAYDADGAGTFKTITFTADVTWSTLQDFIKTAKGGWDPGMKFTKPADGQNCVRVAADGNSYTWDTYVDLTTDFYLAGSFNTWSTTANRFMKASGDATEATVTINITEYSNITFKVIDNGNWRGCNPVKTITKDDNSVTILSDAEGHNVAMTPYAAGDYIFTLDLTTREVTVSYPDGDPMPIPTNIYLSCDVLNSWAAADPAYKFAVSGDIATLDVTLDALTNYAFKLVFNDAWLGANYNFKYYWCTDVPMIADETQANLYSFKEGTYTFTYNLTSGELSIAYPATTATNMTISEYEYATLYSATAFDVPAEVEAYVIPEVDGIKLTMERIYRIPANTGVLLHAAQGTYPFYEGDGRWMDAPASNLLRGTTTDETINNDKVHYVLSYDTEYNVGFYWPYGTGATYGVGAFENKAGKAYLELGGQAASVIARRGFPIRPVQDAATGLDEIESQGEAQKVIHNGQLLIIREGRIYNAQGARVQ